ncbi:MAG: hypothetical protein KatS3mg104_1535 [Phycisphaerae bacterium]|nr:MAG: hypothetical protein KatS3mg104_1535 [Phycisphaerae bacterium]
MSQLACLSGITSKRRLGTLVDELQQAGLIISRKLPERGSPRLIESISEDIRLLDGMRRQ